MPLSDKEKENIISKALGSPEGRIALAQAMVQPISEMLDIWGFGSNDLFSCESDRNIALAALSRYENNIAKGKVYSDFITNDIKMIYVKWGIKEGSAINTIRVEMEEQKRIALEEMIGSRFDILDL